MDDKLMLHNRLKEIRVAQKLSRAQLAAIVGVSGNAVISIETDRYSSTAKLA